MTDEPRWEERFPDPFAYEVTPDDDGFLRDPGPVEQERRRFEYEEHLADDLRMAHEQARMERTVTAVGVMAWLINLGFVVFMFATHDYLRVVGNLTFVLGWLGLWWITRKYGLRFGLVPRRPFP